MYTSVTLYVHTTHKESMQSTQQANIAAGTPVRTVIWLDTSTLHSAYTYYTMNRGTYMHTLIHVHTSKLAEMVIRSSDTAPMCYSG